MTAEVLRYAAFTSDGHGGNPAGVVLGAGALTETEMLATAQAIGFSETAFFVRTAGPARAYGNGGAAGRIRYFSPLAEVAFCGHATVATAIALAERHGPHELHLDTPAGPVEVVTRLEDGDLVATLTSRPTRTRPIERQVLEEALAALRWTPHDLDPRFPVHVAFAGNHHLVLGVRDRDTLAGLDYDYPALAALMAREQWTTAHLFTAAGATSFHVRNPFPPGGVVEDPATGAAAAAFGGYLRDLGLVPVPSRVTLHQGEDMGAPSRLVVDIDPTSASVQVSGRATRLPLPDDDVSASSYSTRTDRPEPARGTP